MEKKMTLLLSGYSIYCCPCCFELEITVSTAEYVLQKYLTSDNPTELGSKVILFPLQKRQSPSSSKSSDYYITLIFNDLKSF